MSDDSLMKEGLCNTSESAVFLGVSRSTVYLLMETGRLPYVKIRRSRRIPRQALIDFAKANLHKAGCSSDLVEISRNQTKRLRR